jgi:glutathione S-transferase
MLKIYADPITVNCRKVFAGLQLIGAPYEVVHVDYFKGEQKSDAYRAVNPNLSLPAMADGDFVLWESNSILQYAADQAGNTAVYPRDLKTRTDINRWMFWESAQWFPSTYVYLVENCVKPVLGAQPDAAVLEAQSANFHKLAGILDERLANNRYLTGEQVTIADIAIAAPAHLHGWQKLPLNKHPNLRRWLTQDIESLPCWKNTVVYEGFTTTPAQSSASLRAA